MSVNLSNQSTAAAFTLVTPFKFFSGTANSWKAEWNIHTVSSLLVCSANLRMSLQCFGDSRNTVVWFKNPVYKQLLFLEKLMEGELVCLFLYNPNVCYLTIIIHFCFPSSHSNWKNGRAHCLTQLHTAPIKDSILHKSMLMAWKDANFKAMGSSASWGKYTSGINLPKQ